MKKKLLKKIIFFFYFKLLPHINMTTNCFNIMTIKSFNNTVLLYLRFLLNVAAIKLLQRATIITSSCKFGRKKQSNKLKLIFLCIFTKQKNKIYWWCHNYKKNFKCKRIKKHTHSYKYRNINEWKLTKKVKQIKTIRKN